MTRNSFFPALRLVLFVGGIMTLFQSVQITAPVRGGFLGLMLLCAVPALLSLRRAAEERGVSARRFRAPILLLLTIVVASTLVLVWNPRPVDDWLRDATPYIFLMLGPIFGLDAALHMKRRTLEALTVVVGFVGAFSFMVAWLSRRGYALGGMEQFALASSALAIASIVMCLVFVYRRGTRAPWLWAAAAFIQAGLLLGAGGRSTVIYLVVLFGVVVVLGGLIGNWVRGTLILVAVGFVTGAVLLWVVSALGMGDFLVGRFDWFEQGITFESIERDGSGQDRLLAYQFTAEAFAQSPLFGQGFGYIYIDPESGLLRPGIYTVDSPLIYLSKFGIIGAVALLSAIVLLIRAAGTFGSPAKQVRREIALFLTGNVAVWIAVLPSGAPSEQKGFAVQVALMVALAGAWALSSTEPSAPPAKPRRRTYAASRRW